MPLTAYSCECGNNFSKYTQSAANAPKQHSCPKCGAEAKRVFGATSNSHKITIDNGFMTRSVEVLPDIMEINDDRSDKDYSEE